MATFDALYRQLAKATMWVLYAVFAFLGLALLSALLGLRDAVVSFRNVAAALGFVFGAMLAVFLLTTLVAAVARYLNRRGTPAA